MYWIFAIIFSIAIMIPDIIRGNISVLAEERAEETAIFLLGSVAFLAFVQNERRIAFQKKEKANSQKQMNQAMKDLIDSYSYIGEVNRKMDILMDVTLDLADFSALDKKKEKEVYESIINAANFLLKADFAMIRFINLKTNKIEKEISLSRHNSLDISNKDIADMGENINVKKQKDILIISSPRKIGEIKSYIIVAGYDENEESKPKNIEILKLFASQAIFLYSYILKENKKEDRVVN
jgi:hypothetical protein